MVLNRGCGGGKDALVACFDSQHYIRVTCMDVSFGRTPAARQTAVAPDRSIIFDREAQFTRQCVYLNLKKDNCLLLNDLSNFPLSVSSVKLI